MKQVGNDIKVLLTKANKDVKVDDIGGELIIYDNSQYILEPDSTQKFLLKTAVFSGVAISDYSDIVKPKLEDFYEEDVRFTLYKNYIYVTKTETMDTTDPVAVVRFVPTQDKFWAGDYFYAHFIEIDKQGG